MQRLNPIPPLKTPLVSVIVPTKNSAQFLQKCLQSIKDQTYPNIEIIVVDNHSTDTTVEIAKLFTDKIFIHGPERSAQVNFGVTKAKGAYVYKVDSDFVLDPRVVQQCVTKISKGFDAVVVHNTPDETVSWIAKIRKFEVDMYKFDITHSSARFVKKEVYEAIGGFNEKITAGEDYDFQNKLNRKGYKTGFIDTEALHLGEPTHLLPHLIKYYRYGKDFVNYQYVNKLESKKQLQFARIVYFEHWRKFLIHPMLGSSFICYNALKYSFGSTGYIAAYFSKSRKSVRSNSQDIKTRSIRINESVKVTVAIRTLNVERILQDCLDALAVQDRKPDEVLIVDNMSTDKTLEIAESFNKMLPLRFIENKVLGYSTGLNLAAQLAEGKLIVYLSADVRPDPDWLGELIRVYEENRVAVVQSWESLSIENNDIHFVLDAEQSQRPSRLTKIEYFNNVSTLYDLDILKKYLPFVGQNGGEDSQMSLKYKKAGLIAILNPFARVVHDKFSTAQEFRERMRGHGRAAAELFFSHPFKPRLYLNAYYWALREMLVGFTRRDSRFIKVGWWRMYYCTLGLFNL